MKKILSAVAFCLLIGSTPALAAEIALITNATANTTSDAVEITGFFKAGITFKAAATSSCQFTVQQSIWSKDGPWEDVFTVTDIGSTPKGYTTIGGSVGWVRVSLHDYNNGTVSAKLLYSK